MDPGRQAHRRVRSSICPVEYLLKGKNASTFLTEGATHGGMILQLRERQKMECMATSRRRPPCLPPKPNDKSLGEGREKRDISHSMHLVYVVNSDFAGIRNSAHSSFLSNPADDSKYRCLRCVFAGCGSRESSSSVTTALHSRQPIVFRWNSTY